MATAMLSIDMPAAAQLETSRARRASPDTNCAGASSIGTRIPSRTRSSTKPVDTSARSATSSNVSRSMAATSSVAAARDLGEVVQLGQILGVQSDGSGRGVVLEMAQPSGAGDRDDQLGLGKQPRDRDLRRRCAPAIGDRSDPVDDHLVRPYRLLGEPRERGAEVVRVGRGGRHRSGEEPASEGRIGDERGAVRRAPRHDVVQTLGEPQRELRLHARNRVDRVGERQLVDVGLGQAERANLPRSDQLGHGSPRLFERDGGIDPMELIQVDHVGLEPAQGSVDRLADVFRAGVVVKGIAAVGTGHQAGLGRQHRSGAASPERTADQLLVRERTVDVGRVQQDRPQIQRAVDDVDGLGLRRVADVGPVHRHAAEPDLADRDPARSEHSCVHAVLDPASGRTTRTSREPSWGARSASGRASSSVRSDVSFSVNRTIGWRGLPRLDLAVVPLGIVFHERPVLHVALVLRGVVGIAVVGFAVLEDREQPRRVAVVLIQHVSGHEAGHLRRALLLQHRAQLVAVLRLHPCPGHRSVHLEPPSNRLSGASIRRSSRARSACRSTRNANVP